MSEKGNGKDFIVGAVIGGIVGAVTALLFAPKSGKELRQDISEQAQQIGEKTKEIASDVSHKTQEIAKTVGTQTTELLGKAKDVASAVADDVKTWKDARKEVAVTSELRVEQDAEALPEGKSEAAEESK